MNDKKWLLKFSAAKIFKKVIGLLAFIMVSFSLFCLPVMAEQDAEENSTQNTGGDLYKEYPVNIYKNPEGIQTYANLPDSVNLSTSQYFPPIGKQQGGSCSAWSKVYYQFTYEVAKINEWDVKGDNSKIFSPKYVWNYLNNGENNGLFPDDCYKFLERQGALRWNEFPQGDLSFDWYEGANETATVNALRQALKTRISFYDHYNFADPSNNPNPITENKDSDLSHMKQLLNEGHILSISTDCNVSTVKNNKILPDGTHKGEHVIIAGEAGNGGHALTIVGYDDTISYDLDQSGSIDQDYEKGAFLIANSWGTGAWGHNNGYIWVMYDALNQESKASDLNTNRLPFIRSNIYWYIEVANYTPERMVEVTLEQRYRNEITVFLGTSSNLDLSPSYRYTFLNNLGGAKSFDGKNNGYQTRTFVFDYANIENIDNKVCWVKVSDFNAGDGANTIVKKIRWVDGNGNALKTITPQTTLNGTSESYYYGIPVKSIKLSKTSSSLYIGDTEQLTATVLPDNATDKSLQWKSSNTSVVRVSSSGLVTCVGTGTATVTATTKDGSNISASCIYQITDDYQNTYDKAYGISMHTKTPGAINMSGDVDFFKFTPSASGVYLFYTTGSTDTRGYLYDSSLTVLAENDDAWSPDRNFGLKYNLVANKTYYIKVAGYNNSATGAYTLNISKDFYGASLASNNQDARRVQMQAEAAAALTSLKLKIGSNTYTLTKPSSGNLDTIINGAHFKVTFKETNNGLSTIWEINAKIPVTKSQTTDTVSFDFSKGTITNVKSPDFNGLVAYDSAIITGVDVSASNSLQKLRDAMKRNGYSLEVRNWNNTLVNITSTTRAASGMKIIERDDTTGLIRKIYYVVVFGDVTGGGIVNIGDARITPDDALDILNHLASKSQLGALAQIAADTDHDGSITADDALLINKHVAGTEKINQNYTITTVPDDCYYLDPVTF